MALEFKVTVQDTPGTLARLGAVLGDADINVEAIQGTSREGKGFIQFVPDDPDRAALALDAAGIAYSRRDVLVIRVLDQPGMLGDVALVMSRASINIVLPADNDCAPAADSISCPQRTAPVSTKLKMPTWAIALSADLWRVTQVPIGCHCRISCAATSGATTNSANCSDKLP